MTGIIKKLVKIVVFAMCAVAIIVVAFIIALNSSSYLQTKLTEKAISFVQNKFDGKIEFSKIEFKPFNSLVISDACIIDDKPFRDSEVEKFEVQDTLFKAKSITTSFSVRGLMSKKGIFIKMVRVEDALFALTLEPNGNEVFTNLARIFRLGSTKTQQNNDGHFKISEVEVENLRFRLRNFREQRNNRLARKDSVKFGIDWNDIDLIGSVKGRNLEWADGYMGGIADKISFNEKSGYKAISLSGKAKVGHGKTIVSNIKLTDPWSKINLEEYTMTYRNTESFLNYITDVRMGAILKPSLVNLKSISYFAPIIEGADLLLNISSGVFEGPVEDINIKSLSFKDTETGVGGQLKLRLCQILSMEKISSEFEIKDFSFTTSGLSEFIKGIKPSVNISIDNIAKGKVFTFNGQGGGPLNKFDIYGDLTSEIGRASANVEVKNLTDRKFPISISGKIRTRDIDIKEITQNKALRWCSMYGGVQATFAPEGTSFKIDSIFIERLNFLEYDYSGIAATGTYKNDTFNGKIICNDPNLNFIFQGIFNTSAKAKNAVYKFYANLGYADLYALKLDKKEISKVSMRMNANYIRVGKYDLIGALKFADISFSDTKGKHDLGGASIVSHSNDNVHRIKFESGFAQATYVASKPLSNFIEDVMTATVKKELPALFSTPNSKWPGNNYGISLRFGDCRDLLAYAVPGLYIGDSTSLNLHISTTGKLNLGLQSPRIAFDNKYLKEVNININNFNDVLTGKMDAAEMDLASFRIKDGRMSLSADNNSIKFKYAYGNTTQTASKGELNADAILKRGKQGKLELDIHTLPSEICSGKECWKISPAKIHLTEYNVKFKNLIAAHKSQSIKLDGGYSFAGKDTLQLDMEKFDLDRLNGLIKEGFNIQGKATGTAKLITNNQNRKSLLLNINSDSTVIAGKDVGSVHLSSIWKENEKKFDIYANNLLDGIKNFDFNGYFFPKDNYLSGQLKLEKLNVGYFYPVLNSIFSEMNGSIGGEIKMKGKLDDLDISSNNLKFENTSLRLGYTNVLYKANGPFHLTKKSIVFDNVKITDNFNGQGNLNGDIDFRSNKGLLMNMLFDLNNIEALNTTANNNEFFYGNLFASGKVGLLGPANNLLIDISAITTKNGTFNIPLSSANTTGGGNLLTFKEEEKTVYVDPYEAMMSKKKIGSNAEMALNVKLKIQATPTSIVKVEMDKSTGNVLTCHGSGTIFIDAGTNGFSINGDYNVKSGNFHFNAMNLAERDFTLQDGSSIRFNGELPDSDLDIKVVYTTKTTLSTLLSDKTSVATRRPVECGIKISDKLCNPHLNFTIDIPNLDPTTKSRVETALNTDDKVQKQFLSLLISNSFLPDEQSGIVNNTNVLYSNVAEVMANQLNTIFQKLEIPLDLGLSYQSNEAGNNLIDVAVSTRLFNNRVVVNGTIGNKKNENTSSQTQNTTFQDFVGDLDIEVKLDRAGAVRLNLFSHSTDQYTNYLDNLQRNGIGFIYQKEYSTFKQFLKHLFSGRKKREELEIKQIEARQNEERKVITIQND